MSQRLGDLHCRKVKIQTEVRIETKSFAKGNDYSKNHETERRKRTIVI